jgi:hypothetical protein
MMSWLSSTLTLALVGLAWSLPTSTACVATACTVSCNASLPEPCCHGVGRCEWDPVFVDCKLQPCFVPLPPRPVTDRVTDLIDWCH